MKRNQYIKLDSKFMYVAKREEHLTLANNY